MLNFTDLETTYVLRGKSKSPLPYHPANKVVSMGWAVDMGDVVYRFLHHRDTSCLSDPVAVHAEYQALLDKTTLFIAHNVKFDLGWIKEMGFKYEGPVWDTAVVEYVLARGRKIPISLKECCDRYNTDHKKLDTVEEYFDKSVPTEEIPAEVLRDYGPGDVLALRDLYHAQLKELSKPENAGLLPTIRMMNEFCLVLIEMERNGLKVDLDELAKVRKEFADEKAILDERLFSMAASVMGDRPYNLASPEQLSQILYSRKVRDKKQWAESFNIGTETRGAVKKIKYKARMSAEEFRQEVRANTTVVYREKAQQCSVCAGKGKTNQVLAGGRIGKRIVNCKACSGTGITYTQTGKVAGFKLIPGGPQDCSAGGFATDKETLESLSDNTSSEQAKEFLKSIQRVNALETYLSTYCDGIKGHVLENGLLHPGLNQTITATGRLSSSNPNFQNLPRGNTFPVKRAIVSRFEGGSILEADYAGAEYRVAVFLAQDAVGLDDIKSKRDAHTFTRQKLQEGGMLQGLPDKVARQEAKPDTFKPLYGGQSGNDAQRKYYKWFLDKHAGIRAWHDDLQTEAINTKKIRIPSGREYAFPDAERTNWGGSTFSTQIKNYPVQGFATGDMVPIGCILVLREMKRRGLKSLMILEVHDSVLIDVYPGEFDACVECCVKGLLGVVEDMVRRYNVYFNVPLAIELKDGRSWLEAKEFLVKEHPGLERPNGH